jgi:diacylglycerol kinase family enzyme
MRGAAEIVNLKGLLVKLTTPEGVYEEEMYCMLVMNGISAGGVKKLSPESDIQDGLLNVILFRKMPVVDILPTLVSILNGHHIEKKNVLTFETDELLIESPEYVSTDVDGEHGETLPLKFKVLKKGLRVITGDGEKIC